MKKSVAILGIALACATGANAQSKFSGGFAQIGLGYENASATVGNEVFNDGADHSVVSNIKKSKGFNLPISAGYTFDLSGSYSIAIGAEYTPTKRIFDVTAYIPDYDQPFDPSTATVKNRYALYLAPGYALTNDSQLYAKIGYASGRFVLNDGTGDNARLHGLVFGIGYKSFITSNVYFYVEGDYTKIRPAGISGAQEVGGMPFTYSYDVHGSTINAVAGIGYKF